MQSLKENESLKEVESIELMNDEKVAEDKMLNRIDEKLRWKEHLLSIQQDDYITRVGNFY